MPERERLLEYTTELKRGARILCGVFISLVFLVGTTIVACQWLAWSPGDQALPTDPASIPIGLLFALGGAWIATSWERVTVDPTARSVVWARRALGLRLRAVTWEFADITSISLHRIRLKNQHAYRAIASGPKGSRVLVDYFHSANLPPNEVRETARTLGLELVKAD